MLDLDLSFFYSHYAFGLALFMQLESWEGGYEQNCLGSFLCFFPVGIGVSVASKALVSFPDPQYGTRTGLAEGLGMRLQNHLLCHI